MQHKILLIEDTKEIYNMVNQSLAYIADLSWASTITDAKRLITSERFDLILLDVQLPDGNGIDFCVELQAGGTTLQTPIFFLTASNTLSEKVMGFSAGADDYIVKPFSPIELKARVESKLKKIDIMKQASDVLQWDEIKINKNKQEVEIRFEEDFNKVDLTALEFKLLIYLASSPNDVFSRDEILNEIWGDDIHVYSRSVDTHISKLRKKLGPASYLIKSIHGSGYKFSPKSN